MGRISINNIKWILLFLFLTNHPSQAQAESVAGDWLVIENTEGTPCSQEGVKRECLVKCTRTQAFLLGSQVCSGYLWGSCSQVQPCPDECDCPAEIFCVGKQVYKNKQTFNIKNNDGTCRPCRPDRVQIHTCGQDCPRDVRWKKYAADLYDEKTLCYGEPREKSYPPAITCDSYITPTTELSVASLCLLLFWLFLARRRTLSPR